MTDTEAIHILARAILVASQILVPVLLTALVVGVVVSLLQAATQVQEMTLTFVPKLGAAVVVLLLMGPWMIGKLVDFTRELLRMLPDLVR